VRERFPLAIARDRWTDCIALEHATLPLPRDFLLEDDHVVVERAPATGRRIGDGRIPLALAPSLFLQAAAAVAFWASNGCGVDAEDLLDARWEAGRGAARLTLARSPAGLRGSGGAPPAAEALASLLARLFARRGRVNDSPAADLAERLGAGDGIRRRPDFWVAAAYRTFPDLATGARASARLRTIGSGGVFLREAARRAVAAKGRAALSGRPARVFSAGRALSAGSALGFPDAPRGAADAARRLRARHEREAGGRKAVWIAVDPRSWDRVSRRAFDTAARHLDGEVDVVEVPPVAPAPRLPDEWRREIWVPCGALQASVRFYEALAERTREAPGAAGALVAAAVSSPGWAAFAADATGDLPPPLPESAPASTRKAPARRGPARREAGLETDPGGRIALLLSSGDVPAALEGARRWIEASPDAPAENWFELSAALAAAAGPALPSWLGVLEAEREISGGRLDEAEARLGRIVEDAAAGTADRRRASLRRAELGVAQGDFGGAGDLAAQWKRRHPDAPPAEAVRALRVEAACRARGGDYASAGRLLDAAERIGVSLGLDQRLENALVRATLLSLQGLFAEEKDLYESWRPVVARAGDDGLMARLLAREALGLSDRREFAAAAARLEQASEVLRDDPVERARTLIDLAATFYHAGRTARCDALLAEAIACADMAGREDLARIARGNRLELSIDRCEWDAARAEVAALSGAARAEGDARRLLVALHQGSRLALRVGDFETAARENGQARELARRLSDRLEIGELWLEEGDRLACSGAIAQAREAYERAAADPPDRADTERRARQRLAELATPDPDATRAAHDVLEEAFANDAYAAAESAARRHAVLSSTGGSLGASWRSRAEGILRSRGGSELADRVFGCAAGSEQAAPPDALRGLRLALARALSGEDAEPALAPLGLERLRVTDEAGRVLASLGDTGGGEGARRRLQAGTTAYALEVWPQPPESTVEAIALLVETLLFRVAATVCSADHARGWLRFGIVAADAAMEEPYRRLCLFAPQPVTALVLGESGTGKEAVARAVHALSPRGSGRFVAVNVAAIPAGLLESELFGHVRGAFTGADRERRGLIEEADGGTIFFDEIGDLDLALQAKLLRALQEGEVRRVGESRARRVDVRVVSATARDLVRDVSAGRFREDLYYRLHVAVIPLPALRHRGRDVHLLARHFLERYAREYARGGLQFAPEAIAAIAAHGWPGNVRELQNAVSQAAVLAQHGRPVTVDLLPEPVRRAHGASSPSVDYRSRVNAHRRDLIREALERTGGNRSRAARDLGLSRQALLYLIRELKVPAAPRAAR